MNLSLNTLPGALVLLVCLTSPLAADVVETRSGARLVGTVTAIDGSTITLETDYAGEISVKQEEVVRLETDRPQVYRLSGGTVMAGTLATTDRNELQIRGGDGVVTTRVGNLAASWPVEGEDPAMTALRRRWEYEAGVDITGKSGNSSQLGTSVNAAAALKSGDDTLQFYTAYNRQKSEGVKSVDQFKAGIDYQNNIGGSRYSWYVRDEGGFDRIKGIDLYNIAAAGFGYDFVREEHHTLTGRVGLSFRYEGYEDPMAEDVRSAGLDLGLKQEIEFARGELTNSLSVVPAFDDFGNFRALHDSFYEVPIAASHWKLRMGVSNDYSSEPPPGREELDTTYYTRLVLKFE